MLIKETPADFRAQVSARLLELTAELPSPSQQVVPSAGEDLRRTLVEACAGHSPGAPLPPVVTHFAVRVASIVELLQASLLHDDLIDQTPVRRPPAAHLLGGTDAAQLTRLAVKEAAGLGPMVSRTVGATVANLARGELFRLACVLGGQVAGRSEADLDLLGRFGMELGAAVQILDDGLEEADDYFRRAVAQLDALSDEQVRERIVLVVQSEWSKLQ